MNVMPRFSPKKDLRSIFKGNTVFTVKRAPLILQFRKSQISLEKIAAKQSPLLNLENSSPALGSENAPVTIVEFGDYQCEACYHWFHNTRDTLIDNYIETGKAKLVFVCLLYTSDAADE